MGYDPRACLAREVELLQQTPGSISAWVPAERKGVGTSANAGPRLTLVRPLAIICRQSQATMPDEILIGRRVNAGSAGFTPTISVSDCTLLSAEERAAVGRRNYLDAGASLVSFLPTCVELVVAPLNGNLPDGEVVELGVGSKLSLGRGTLCFQTLAVVVSQHQEQAHCRQSENSQQSKEERLELHRSRRLVVELFFALDNFRINTLGCRHGTSWFVRAYNTLNQK